MKKFLISYGDDNYRKSLKRLKNEAIATNEFDEVIIYTPENLPYDIRNHELMKYSRGGGYWFWKPWIVCDALRKCTSDEDIVVYSDAGNSLYQHKEWLSFWNILRKKNAIFFYCGGKMKNWTRKNLLHFTPPIANH